MFEMPGELSEFTIYFLIIASMVTSFISSAFGIGGGAILIGLLAIKLSRRNASLFCPTPSCFEGLKCLKCPENYLSLQYTF